MLYPIGIQTFKEIRTKGFVYIDKTALLYKIVSEGKYYFLSRPRRFGKSLLLSTIRSYFEGEKDLFEGLAISNLEKDWNNYPVLRLDWAAEDYHNNFTVVKDSIKDTLSEWEKTYGVTPAKKASAASRFKKIIKTAFEKTGRQVVILVDEYDKPILDNLDLPAVADKIRRTLKSFYGVLKPMDEYIRIGFITGVTKLGKMSIFSDLNNLEDISMDRTYSTLCGITQKEIDRYFPPEVKALAEANGLTEDDCRKKLTTMYDGYKFHPQAEGVFNPYSLLQALKKKDFGSYWFETGTPTFLVRYLLDNNIKLGNLTGTPTASSLLTGTNYEKIHPVTLLFQSGYLTIDEFDSRSIKYTLKYPNREVENGFFDSLSDLYTPMISDSETFSVEQFSKDLCSGNAGMFMTRLQAFYADLPYEVQPTVEASFQNTMLILCKLMGQNVEVERRTSNGRIDVLIQTDRYVYIIELKRDKDPDYALDQIDGKGYDFPFKADGRKVFKIGADFSTKDRRLDSWTIKEA
ncbi:MAG: AAA family ATPase [Bacteroidales bacterium]|nr:AAA family ATPase [Bacteroidales bacterium]